jgi:hypothetical protein
LSTAVLAVGTVSTTTEVESATLISIAAILGGVTTMTAVVGATSSASEWPAV